MATVRLTAFLRDDDGHGWTETHDQDGGAGSISLTTHLSAFHNLMKTLRREMLVGDSFYLGCRASYKTADNAIAGDNILENPPLRGPTAVNGVELHMGKPSVAVKMRFRNDASTARSDVYLRGGPKEMQDWGLLSEGGNVMTPWTNAAKAYAAALVAQKYGWVGINPAKTSRGDVTGYTQNANGTVTLMVDPSNNVPLPAAKTRLPVKFARINGSNSALNTSLVCKVDDLQKSLTTIEVIAVRDFATGGTYIAQVKDFIPYAALTYMALSSRKTGRPFNAQPGRLRAKARS